MFPVERIDILPRDHVDLRVPVAIQLNQRGKLADLVVLGRDPLREDPLTLVKIPIERTMLGGRWVFGA